MLERFRKILHMASLLFLLLLHQGSPDAFKQAVLLSLELFHSPLAPR
jgi:hypothetical protein